MAFKKTSGAIVIDATLTEIGRRKMANGEFLVTKFALGDDEINYDLHNKNIEYDEGKLQAALTLPVMEAYSNRSANIHYGPVTHITDTILYIPELVVNSKLQISPEKTGDFYYVMANDETTEKVNEIFSNSKIFLQSNVSDKAKIVVESGINNADAGPCDKSRRDVLLLSTGLLDQYMYVICDYRLVESVLASSKESKFKNFPNGDTNINFETLGTIPATSHENGFKYFRTYLAHTTPNLMMDYDKLSKPSLEYSDIVGPRGSVVAINVNLDSKLRSNSTGTRDSRWAKLGHTEKVLFSDNNSKGYKFDYIETTIYIVGTVSNSEIQVPLRLLRYSGT